MRCRKVPKLLSLRIDGLVPARRAAALGQHLARCADCRLVAERMERAWGGLARLELPGAAPDDWAAIVVGVEARRRPWLPAWLEFGLAPSRAATAAVLVAMAILGGAGATLLVRTMPFARPISLESEAIAETLGELPWNSPVSGLGPMLDGAVMQEVRP